MNRTSRLLIDESPLQVLPSLAMKIGLDEAVILQQIHYLTRIASEGCYNEGGTFWVKRSAEEWHETFKFWSVPTIRRILKNLAKIKAIKTTTKWNTVRTDRTLWYTVDHDSLDASDQVDHMEKLPVDPDADKSKGENLPSDQVDHMILSPDDSKKDILPEAKKSGKKPKSSKPPRNPWSDHTDALFKAMPEEIRPVGVKVAPDGKISGVDYRKHNVKAHSLFDAGFTPQQVFDFVDWLYATNAWYWHGSDGQPVVISMSAVANKIRASQESIKAWITQGRPRKSAAERQVQERPESLRKDRPREPIDVEYVKGENGVEKAVYKWA